jgi:hypothetical protein
MASHNPDPTSRSNQPFDQRIIDLAKSAGDQAPLHDPGGRETPPARDSQGSTPFVVRVGLEAARSYLPEGGCDGSTSCPAQLHTHGCFNDFGDCDEPTEHYQRPSLRPVELHP